MFFQPISDPKKADKFLSTHKKGSIEQTEAWWQMMNHIDGRKTVGAWQMVDEFGQILAVCRVFSMDTGYAGLQWAFSPRGPVGTPEACQEIIKHIKKILKQQQFVFWKLDPALTEEEWHDFLPVGMRSFVEHKSFQPTDFLLVDLEPESDAILASMKRKGRYNIKLARKKGIVVKDWSGAEADDESIQHFATLMKETTARDGFSAHGGSFYATMLSCLGKKARLFLAFYETTPVAGAIVTLEGTRAVYYYGASSGKAEVRPFMAPYLLQWHAMLWAKENGAKTYNLTGITPKGEEKTHVYAGITQFKTKFGGFRQTFTKGKEIPLRFGVWFVYRCFKFLKKWKK